MKTFKLIVLTLTALLALASLSAALARSAFVVDVPPSQPAADGFYRPTDQLIVQYQPVDGAQLDGPNQASALEQLSDAAGVSLAYVRPMSGDAHVLKLPEAMPESDAAALAARLMALPEVIYAEPDTILFPMELGDQPDAPLAWPVNDPSYSAQWHYFEPGANHFGINAPAAWEIFTGTASTVVAVIDTGITIHPDLAGRTLAGYDFIADLPTANDGNGRDADPSDPGDWVTAAESALVGGPFAGCQITNSTWHGTHVAGTIGAATNNNEGVAGVDWNAKILPVRVMGKCGGYSSDIADGMRWAAGLSVTGVPTNTTPAKVLNLSLGAKASCGTIYQKAIDEIVAAGATVVVSAGNSNADFSLYRPGNCNGVITVAATNRDGGRAFYSNFGSGVEISAPGGEVTSTITANGILSTLNSGLQEPVSPAYIFYQGTSMSAPHVAGVASLLYGRNPGIRPWLVQRLLQESVTPFPVGSTCNTSICGTGIVNAANALRQPAVTNVAYTPFTGTLTQTQLTVSGLNFTISSTILLSGSPLTTTFLSPQSLRATLTISDVFTSTARRVSVRTVFATGVYTSTPVGLFQNYLPLIVKDYGWNPVFSDDFETGLSTSWVVTDTTASGYTWGRSACKPYQGSGSAWMMAGGSKGPAACGSSYADKMNSRMIYGPFSLSNALAAEVRLQLWLNSETNFDSVCLRASKDGANFYGECYWGTSGGWVEKSLNLANVAGLGSLLGQPNVWVALYFASDSSTVKPDGAYVDNFAIRQCLGGNCTQPAAASSPSGLFQYPSWVQHAP